MRTLICDTLGNALITAPKNTICTIWLDKEVMVRNTGIFWGVDFSPYIELCIVKCFAAITHFSNTELNIWIVWKIHIVAVTIFLKVPELSIVVGVTL